MRRGANVSNTGHYAEDAEKESKANTRLALHRRPNTMVHPVALSRQSLTNRANQLIMLRNARQNSERNSNTSCFTAIDSPRVLSSRGNISQMRFCPT